MQDPPNLFFIPITPIEYPSFKMRDIRGNRQKFKTEAGSSDALPKNFITQFRIFRSRIQLLNSHHGKSRLARVQDGKTKDFRIEVQCIWNLPENGRTGFLVVCSPIFWFSRESSNRVYIFW